MKFTFPITFMNSVKKATALVALAVLMAPVVAPVTAEAFNFRRLGAEEVKPLRRTIKQVGRTDQFRSTFGNTRSDTTENQYDEYRYRTLRDRMLREADTRFRSSKKVARSKQRAYNDAPEAMDDDMEDDDMMEEAEEENAYTRARSRVRSPQALRHSTDQLRRSDRRLMAEQRLQQQLDDSNDPCRNVSRIRLARCRYMHQGFEAPDS